MQTRSLLLASLASVLTALGCTAPPDAPNNDDAPAGNGATRPDGGAGASNGVDASAPATDSAPTQNGSLRTRIAP